MVHFGYLVPPLSVLLLVGLPKESAMQTEGSTVEASTVATALRSILGYNFSLYIMIGIAVFYSVATLICSLLVVLNCISGKKGKHGRITPYMDRDLKRPLPTQLETIFEEGESKCSSRASLQASKQHTQDDLTIQNQSALDSLETDTKTTFISKEMDTEGALSIANASALEHESDEEDSTKTEDESGDSGEVPVNRNIAYSFSNKTALEREESEESSNAEDSYALERGTTITTSFKKPVPLGKIGGNGKTSSRTQPSKGSPFLLHIPRGASVSPADVKVPFSEAEPDPKLVKAATVGQKDFKGDEESLQKSRTSSVSSTGSSGTPFRKRKHGGSKEIASSPTSTLTNFARKPSLPGASSTPVVLPPIEPKPAMLGVKASARTVKAPQMVTPQGRSPVRSRPKPSHLIKTSPHGSPSQSSLRQAKLIVAGSAPGIAIHSMSSEDTGTTETPRSSVASTSSSASMVAVTVDVLVKKLEPVQKKWYLIGSQLKVPSLKLNLIVNNHKDRTDLCLMAMCKEWVSAPKGVTWPRVVEALKTELVDEKVLACDIEREFCWVDSSNNSKTWL